MDDFWESLKKGFGSVKPIASSVLDSLKSFYYNNKDAIHGAVRAVASAAFP